MMFILFVSVKQRMRSTTRLLFPVFYKKFDHLISFCVFYPFLLQLKYGEDRAKEDAENGHYDYRKFRFIVCSSDSYEN